MATRTRKPKDEVEVKEAEQVEAPATLTVGQVAVVIAERLGDDTDPTAVSKKLRARIRNNFDALAPRWPGLEEAKENRDGNRYPGMPRELAEEMIEKYAPSPQDDED